MNLKQGSGIRRRRRAVLENRQFYSVLPNDYSHSVVAGNTPYDGAGMRGKTSESLGPVNGREISFMGETNGPVGIDVGERSQHSFDLSESFGEGNGISSSVETNIIKSPTEFYENEVDAIRMLELALEEEKAARSALYLELEKERAAAASAAEEAIAMMSRLQQDKALVELEARQYQRMIEEKSAYDEEEMNILKEILVRRERENHFLEKEIEEYRQMSFRANEPPKDDLHDKKDKWGQMPSSSLERNDNEQLMLQSENNMSIGEEVGSCENCSSNYKDPLVEKQRLIYGYGCLEKNVLLAGKEKGKEDNGIVCQQVTGEAAVTMVPCDGEELEKDGKYKDKSGSNPHGSMLETEPAVYDVYVVDDRNKNCNEQSGKESALFSNAVNEPRDSVVAMGASGVWSREAPSDHPTISRAGTEPNIDKGRLDIGSELPVLSLSCKSLLSDLGKESLSAFDSEKSKIDIEIERLRERLQIVQGEKENLTLCTENVDREKDPLRLLQEISKQLREIQQLRDPTQQAFLPPSSSKDPPFSGDFEEKMPPDCVL
ncbi:myosin-binding protein 7-like isoform X2 [Juglans microcarpa x Juglans regia]|uniref:myosin-binding protein 7-like isoform X2 n=1 Tax=Juglans microcarpa x Juglans regia TaxID=2249226 RepID=UPI001B7E64F6|nr:myosin-binding protein 7-like isoform X2 [Juglans microcarpa x Juglans regia]